MTKKCLDNSNKQTKPTQPGRVLQWYCFHSAPFPCLVKLFHSSPCESEAEGLLSTLSLGHQAAIVAAATNLRVLGQGRGWRSRGRGWDWRSVWWGRWAPRALTLVLVGSAVAPFNMVSAGRGFLLQIKDAVNGALQMLIQWVIWRAAAGEAGVIHVRRVWLAAFGRKQRVSCEGRLWRRGPRGMLVHSECSSCLMSIFSTQPLIFTYICLLVCVLFPFLLCPFSV